MASDARQIRALTQELLDEALEVANRKCRKLRAELESAELQRQQAMARRLEFKYASKEQVNGK